MEVSACRSLCSAALGPPWTRPDEGVHWVGDRPWARTSWAGDEALGETEWKIRELIRGKKRDLAMFWSLSEFRSTPCKSERRGLSVLKYKMFYFFTESHVYRHVFIV